MALSLVVGSIKHSGTLPVITGEFDSIIFMLFIWWPVNQT